MKLFFVVVGHYPGWKDVREMAERNSGCDVRVLGGTTQRYTGWRRAAEEIIGKPIHLHHAHARWFTLADVIETEGINEHVVVMDWDECIFHNLAESWQGYANGADCGATCDERWGESNMLWPHVVSAPLIVQYRDAMWRWLDGGEIPDTDIHGWQRLYSERKLRIVDLQSKPEFGIWDHHMMCGNYRWQRDGCTEHKDECGMHHGKRIVWENGKPFFVTHEGVLEKVNTIHCWGVFKGREHYFNTQDKQA